jgi:hypothetical protein
MREVVRCEDGADSHPADTPGLLEPSAGRPVLRTAQPYLYPSFHRAAQDAVLLAWPCVRSLSRNEFALVVYDPAVTRRLVRPVLPHARGRDSRLDAGSPRRSIRKRRRAPGQTAGACRQGACRGFGTWIRAPTAATVGGLRRRRNLLSARSYRRDDGSSGDGLDQHVCGLISRRRCIHAAPRQQEPRLWSRASSRDYRTSADCLRCPLWYQPPHGQRSHRPERDRRHGTAPSDRGCAPRRAERTRTAGAERARAGAVPTLDGRLDRRPRRSARRLPRPIHGSLGHH